MRTHVSFATSASQVQRVLVIGAGVAGLSAARALRQLGYDVVVLEARDRLGGRCWTVDRVDLGAHWVHSTEGNPISTLARELDVPTLFVGGDSTYAGGWERLVLQGAGGQIVDEATKRQGILAADDVRERLDTLRRRLSNNGQADLSMADAISTVLADVVLDSQQREAVAWHLALLFRDDPGRRRRRPVVPVVGRRVRGVRVRRQRLLERSGTAGRRASRGPRRATGTGRLPC